MRTEYDDVIRAWLDGAEVEQASGGERIAELEAEKEKNHIANAGKKVDEELKKGDD